MLLKLDTIRGPHSTGVLFVNKDNNTEVVKQLGTPWDIASNSVYSRVTKLCHNVLLGHNRYATKGAVTSSNAHPFDFPKLAGAHNGTLTNQSLLDDHINFQVDSENIYHHMNRHGPEATCKALSGAFALTWYNKEDQSVNFLRNDQRELHYAYSEDRKTLIWASEKWMILVACSRQDLKIGEVQEFHTLHHYRMKVPLELYANSTPFEEISVKKLEAYQPPPMKKFPPYQPRNCGSQPAHQQSSVTAMHLHTYLQKEVAFDILGERLINGVNYIEGELISGARVKVRVNKNPDDKLWEDLKRKGVFRGIAKSLSYQSGGYLNMDCRTVVRDDVGADDLGDDDDLLYEVGDLILNEKDAQEFLDKGCAWCTSPEEMSKISDVYVMQDGSYCCTTCMNFKEVQPYIN